MTDQERWCAYTNTKFKDTESLLNACDSGYFTVFAILTAGNPLQSGVSEDTLKDMIGHKPTYRVTSVVGEHAEKCYAVSIPEGLAKRYAVVVKQDAFFYVRNDLLYLIPALDTTHARTYLGKFSERIVR